MEAFEIVDSVFNHVEAAIDVLERGEDPKRAKILLEMIMPSLARLAISQTNADTHSPFFAKLVAALQKYGKGGRGIHLQ